MIIKNIWKNLTFWCIHRHEEPVLLEVQQGPSSPFYACPKYFAENRTEDERMCPNRLNFVDAENIVMEFADLLEVGESNFFFTDWTNYSWVHKNKIFVKVLKYDDDDIRLGIINQRAVK